MLPETNILFILALPPGHPEDQGDFAEKVH